MSEKKPLIISADGYVLVNHDELTRLLAIENRARHKLEQLKADSNEIGKDRRAAHIEALAFVLATDDALLAQRKGAK